MGEQLEKRLIDGHYADSDNIVARCHLLAHRGYLTKNLVKSHGCIAKQCFHFEKRNPKYWDTLSRMEKGKKNNRRKRKQKREKDSDRDTLIRETLEDSGHIHVTSIQEKEGNLLVISYIYDRWVDLAPEMQFLREKLNKTIKLTARVGTEEAIEQFIRRPRRESRTGTDLRKAPQVGNAAKMRLAALGVYCVEDLFGRTGDALYALDCELSATAVNRRYLTAYRSAVAFANAGEPTPAGSILQPQTET